MNCSDDDEGFHRNRRRIVVSSVRRQGLLRRQLRSNRSLSETDGGVSTPSLRR